MSENNKLEITESSGNVFADLSLPNPEQMLAKAELVRQINMLIRKRSLKQKEAADLLNLKQPDISKLSQGDLDGFSLERLIVFLTKLNQDVKLMIKPHRHKTECVGHFTVI